MAVQKVANQLNGQTRINDMVVFNGRLYAGVTSGSKLFRFDDINQQWEEVADSFSSESFLTAIVVYNNELYGTTGTTGLLLKWNGTNAWTQVASQYGTVTVVNDLVVYNNKIYGCVQDNPSSLLEWNGTNAWTQVAPRLASQFSILSMVVFNGRLYAGSSFSGYLFRWNDSNAWEAVTSTLGFDVIRKLIVFENEIYASTQISGHLYKWNGTDDWIKVADVLNDQSLYSMEVINGTLYLGTSIDGNLFKFNKTNGTLEVVEGQLESQITISSLLEYDNVLFGGTSNNGMLFLYGDVISNPTVEEDELLVGEKTEHYAYDLSKSPLKKGEVFDDKVINQSIENILSTLRGERIFQPNFGTILPLMVFENLNVDNANDLLEILLRAIRRFEKRVTVIDSQVKLNILSDQNTFTLSIPYIINRNQLVSSFNKKVVL